MAVQVCLPRPEANECHVGRAWPTEACRLWPVQTAHCTLWFSAQCVLPTPPSRPCVTMHHPETGRSHPPTHPTSAAHLIRFALFGTTMQTPFRLQPVGCTHGCLAAAVAARRANVLASRHAALLCARVDLNLRRPHLCVRRVAGTLSPFAAAARLGGGRRHASIALLMRSAWRSWAH